VDASKALLLALKEKFKREQSSKKYKKILEDLIDPAKPIAASTSRRKAIQVSRRGAKSYSICSILLYRALTRPGTRHLFLALTFKNVKRIAWVTLEKLCKKYGVRYKANGTAGTLTLQNGSVIELAGADGNEALADRFLGAYFDTIAIDEAGSFDPRELDYLIDHVLTPTLIDTYGDLYLLGSPQEIDKGRFFEACHNKHGYEHFSWTTDKNPYIAENFLKEIKELLEINPEIENAAWFRRNYRNEWARDEGDLVYKLSSINLIPTLPANNRVIQYLGGIDFGYEDPCAFVVGCILANDPTLYIIYSYKEKHLGHDDIAHIVSELEIKYPGITFYADSASKMTIVDLSTKYGCNVVSCKKTGTKVERINSINTELLLGRVKLVEGGIDGEPGCPSLIEELNSLPRQKKRRGGSDEFGDSEWREHPAYPNHLTDALSYLWSHSLHHLQQPEEKKDEDQIYMDAIRRREREPRSRRYYR